MPSIDAQVACWCGFHDGRRQTGRADEAKSPQDGRGVGRCSGRAYSLNAKFQFRQLPIGPPQEQAGRSEARVAGEQPQGELYRAYCRLSPVEGEEGAVSRVGLPLTGAAMRGGLVACTMVSIGALGSL